MLKTRRPSIVPEKDIDHAIRAAELTRKAEVLADAWIKHLYTPAEGTGEAYVNARADVVRMFYPEYDGRVPERKERANVLRKPELPITT
jgi:hypothetical protein